MQDLIERLSSIKRPQLLIRAARIAARDYNRGQHLQRLMGYGPLPKPARAVMLLIEQEQQLNQKRVNDDPGYPIFRHIEVMMALMGEAQMVSHNRLRPESNRTVANSGNRPAQ